MGARRLWAGLTDHARGPGFFTSVAATGVLGVKFILLAGNSDVALPLWAFASLLWLGLIYSVIARVAVRAMKATLEQGLNGAWPLVVSTQSL